MKIYKIITITNLEGFGKYVERRCSLFIDSNVQVVADESYCKEFDKPYAVEYDTDHFSIETLMEIMHKNLPLSDVKFICQSDKMLDRLFSSYMKNIPRGKGKGYNPFNDCI